MLPSKGAGHQSMRGVPYCCSQDLCLTSMRRSAQAGVTAFDTLQLLNLELAPDVHHMLACGSH